MRQEPRISSLVWRQVEALLRKERSPEQIVARLEMEQGIGVSHEWIYQYVYADQRSGGDLHRYLRCRKARRLGDAGRAQVPPHRYPRSPAEAVRNAVTEGLAPHINQVHAITYDNGREFSYPARMAKDLDARSCFAHPYASWQRGLNENTNGLIRQYFPKQRELMTVCNVQIKHAMDKLNQRPRKTLGFRTPHEVFFNAKTSLTVALTS